MVIDKNVAAKHFCEQKVAVLNSNREDDNYRALDFFRVKMTS